ncbi:MAG: hypothetical protein JW929_03150 [Anaerolineales bacterium]|nr:hypothetical protein [Anaerolineales bacterium]
MARDFSQVLQQAMEFYVAGQIVEARALLLDVVRADSKLEAGWMFLSYTLEDPGQKADCLRKVLALNPQNTEAKAALEKLENVLHEGPKPPPRTAELLGETPLIVPAESAAARGALPDESPVAPEDVPPIAAADRPGESTAVRNTASTPPEASQTRETLLHAAPFTVDIDHVEEDLSVIADNLLPVIEPGVKTKTSPTPKAQPSESQAGTEKKSPVSSLPPAAPFVQSGEIPAQKTVRRTGGLQKPVAPVDRAKTGTPETAEQKSEQPKKRGVGCTCTAALLGLVLLVAAAGGGLWATGNLPPEILVWLTPQSQPPAAAVTETDSTPIRLILPPESTKTPVPSITSTPTITETPTLTTTPTLAPPDPTVQADIDRLMAEVQDLRGLDMDEDVPVYVVDLTQAESILQQELDRTGYRETLQNEAKSLSVLGFIKPTYDLAEFALSRLADGVMGFYMPNTRTIYIIGNRFAGMERWTFTHEYNHALVHHHFPAVGIMDDDPLCLNDSQRCEAIRALVEGDSMLIMVQWLEQYATPYDIRDIELYPYPFLLPPGQNTPPCFSKMVEFAYYNGLNFVGTLWSLGSWARVNQAYQNLPVSTEQILHPQKYLNGEKPAAMRDPKIENKLGDSWRLIKSDSLGEYMTFLLLSYGSDSFAQIPAETAQTAAAGWGGDRYYVYSDSAQEDRIVLAAEWTWDTNADAADFMVAMQDYLDERFRGEKLGPAPGECWAMNQQTACLFRGGKNILWIIAPDLSFLEEIRSAYTGY